MNIAPANEWRENFNALEFQEFQDGRWYTNVEKLKDFIQNLLDQLHTQHREEMEAIVREIEDALFKLSFTEQDGQGISRTLGIYETQETLEAIAQAHGITIN